MQCVKRHYCSFASLKAYSPARATFSLAHTQGTGYYIDEHCLGVKYVGKCVFNQGKRRWYERLSLVVGVEMSRYGKCHCRACPTVGVPRARPSLDGMFRRRSAMAFPIVRFGKKWEILFFALLRSIPFCCVCIRLCVACITGKTIFALYLYRNANPLRAGIVYCAIYGSPYQRLSC
jgi:hypothetical protein